MLKITDSVEKQEGEKLITILFISEEAKQGDLYFEGITVRIDGGLKDKKAIQMIESTIRRKINEKPNNIEERKVLFVRECEAKLNPYPDKTVIKEFCEYWTESNEAGKKFRKEKEKVFDINKRFATWCRNNKDNFGKGFGNKLPQNPTPIIPTRIHEPKKEDTRTELEKRNGIIDLVRSAYKSFCEHQPYSGIGQIYSFLLSEGKVKKDDFVFNKIPKQKEYIDEYFYKIRTEKEINTILKH